MGGDGKGINCAWVVCVAQKRCKLQGKSKVPIEIMSFQILRHSRSVAQIEKKLVRTKNKKKTKKNKKKIKMFTRRSNVRL